jgi:hypothetical protein
MSDYDHLPPGSAVITPNQMYGELHEIGRKLDRLTAVVDPALAELRKDLGETDRQATLLEARLRVIENWRWFVLGMAAVIGTVAGYGASILAVGS